MYQDLDPYEIKLRINSFEKEDFNMLSSANIGGDALKTYLKTDKKLFLLEAQNREDLGKYLVENIMIDEARNAMMLLKSNFDSDSEPPPVV